MQESVELFLGSLYDDEDDDDDGCSLIVSRMVTLELSDVGDDAVIISEEGTSKLLLQLSTLIRGAAVDDDELCSDSADSTLLAVASSVLVLVTQTSVNSANVTLSLGLLGGCPLPPFMAEGMAGGLTMSGTTMLPHSESLLYGWPDLSQEHLKHCLIMSHWLILSSFSLSRVIERQRIG